MQLRHYALCIGLDARLQIGAETPGVFHNRRVRNKPHRLPLEKGLRD